MFQNLKVDIVYYKTNTDFEMEFNLCGCCRMRLLTDKAPDKKTLVHALSRAVSRSRIIMVVGSLFGENNIIKTASDAIGHPLAELDCKKYGVNSDDKINIIETSVPLVTADGIFGGLIIESGPQAMILLTDNKSVRKTVMQSLIHPYVEELCAAELKEKAANRKGENPIDEEFYEESPLIVPVVDVDAHDDSYIEPEIDSELVEVSDENVGPEFDLINEHGYDAEENDDMEPEFRLISSEDEMQDDELPELSDEDKAFAETILSNSGFTPREIDDEPLEEESDLIFENRDGEKEDGELEAPLDITECESPIIFDEDDEEAEEISITRPKPKAGLTVAILCLAIFLLLTLVVLCYCIFFIPSLESISPMEYIRDIFNTLT